MHWILQTNMFQEKEWENLVACLERFKIPYSVHKVIPFIGELIPPAEPQQDKVVCFGSYSMRHTAKAMGWNPGVYDLFDQNFNVQMNHWKKDMLNADSIVCAFKDAAIVEPAFIRPIDDSKYFAGRVFDPEEFNTWQHGICLMEEDYGNSLTKDTLIQLCKPKVIYSEYRHWIVDRRIVTKSLYKRGDRVIYSSDVDIRFDRFVAQLIHNYSISMIGRSGWEPHRAYVLDVCETPDGIKIVEINTINSAGFYAGNVQDIVMALENMENGL
ncbi:MAG: hypothetical protein JWP44_5028 [Mucilaginibacter sp.]|nr:hypothetical protein [Mucilaginibacter sp.]